MENNQGQKPKQDKNKKYMLVSYGLMNMIGWFEHNEKHIPRTPTRVVIKTERGLELGTIVGNLTGYKTGNFKMSQEQLQEYYEDSEIEAAQEPIGRVVRLADEEDINEEKHLKKIAKEEIECCKKYAKELDLPMKIISAEHIFGGERVIFYFMAEARVDFRTLVKKIAHEYQTRIEMRQIGSRDEAKLLGDYETCGQQCCCQKFLKALKPVNMRMAKMQKATLDPSKISGYCGRLKCCLRYEDTSYTELKRNLPRKNSPVRTPKGTGKVIDTQIITQLVIVASENGERNAWPVDEISVITPEEAAKSKKQQERDESKKTNAQNGNAEAEKKDNGNGDSNGKSKTDDNENGKNSRKNDGKNNGKRRRGRGRRRRKNNKPGNGDNKTNNNNNKDNSSKPNNQNKPDNSNQQ